MKDILFIMEGLSGGGAEKALIELLKRIDYNRYKVTLCVVFYGGVYMDQIPSQVKVVYLFPSTKTAFQASLERKALRYFRKYNNTWVMSYLLWQKIKQPHFDTIVSFIEGYPLAWHYLIRKRAKHNIAWVHCDLYTVHWTLTYFKSSRAEQSYYEGMDRIMFVSQHSMCAFEKLYNLDVRKDYIYNIIDKDAIRMLATTEVIPHENFTITAIGRLSEIKGYDRLLRVASMFENNGYTLSFQIIGVGEDEEKLIGLRDELGLQNMITFLGFISNPYPYLKSSDVFISTSLAEGLPWVICESLILGIPVVATRTAGAIELLDNGKYGILTDHTDSSIYEGLKKLVDNKQLRDEYRNLSGERVEIFDMGRTMNQVDEILSK